MASIPQMVEPDHEPTELHPRVTQEYGFQTYVYFDIETIPTQDPDALAKCREKVTPPGNIKKQETIDLWMAENADKAARKMLDETSFDGGRGHVCTIGWAFNDGPVRVEHAEGTGEEPDILAAFFKALPARDAVLVGHNIAGFDIPFLLQRGVILGLDLPSDWIFPRDPKPWSKEVFDTMHAWAGARGTVSMNALCGMLGIVGKEDFDGSMVAEAWASGQHEIIAHYCDSDVRRTRAIHQKFLAAGF